MVWAVVSIDPDAYLLQRELAVVDPRGRIHIAPDQSIAQARLFAWRQRLRPGALQQFGIQIVKRTIGIDIDAGEIRSDQRAADPRYGFPQRFHVGVLATPKTLHRDGRTEVLWVTRAAVRRIANQRQGLSLRFG